MKPILIAILCLLPLPALANDQAEVSNLISTQIQPCWNKPSDAGERAVSIRMRLKMDGSLDGEPEIVGEGTQPDQYAQSALRAVLRCAPFSGLDSYAGDYAVWREIVLNFKG